MVIFFKKHKSSFRLASIIIAAVFLSRLVLYLTFIFYSIINKSSLDFKSFIFSINKWDAEWYKDIIINGYRDTQQGCRYSWNFFPLFPLLIKFFHLIIPVDPYYLGTFVNSILLIFVCYYVYKYLLLTRLDKRIGYIAIFLLCFGPWSMYTAELMSETLFMLLLILVFYFMKTNKLIIMGVCGALLSATRLNGVLIIIPILIYFYLSSKETKFQNKLLSIIKNSKLMFSICLIPIGIFAYMLYLQITIHDGLGFIHSQKYGWGHQFKGIFSVMFENLVNAPLLVIVVITAILIAVYLIKKGRIYEALFPFMTLLLEMPYDIRSSPRYMFASITIMFGFLDLINNIKPLKSKWSRVMIFTILFILEIELSSFVMFNKFSVYVI